MRPFSLRACSTSLRHLPKCIPFDGERSHGVSVPLARQIRRSENRVFRRAAFPPKHLRAASTAVSPKTVTFTVTQTIIYIVTILRVDPGNKTFLDFFMKDAAVKRGLIPILCRPASQGRKKSARPQAKTLSCMRDVIPKTAYLRSGHEAGRSAVQDFL